MSLHRSSINSRFESEASASELNVSCVTMSTDSAAGEANLDDSTTESSYMPDMGDVEEFKGNRTLFAAQPIIVGHCNVYIHGVSAKNVPLHRPWKCVVSAF